MIKTILTIIFLVSIIFDCAMVTPIGAGWIFKNLDEGKPVYGIIIMFIITPIIMVIGTFLGLIK